MAGVAQHINLFGLDSGQRGGRHVHPLPFTSLHFAATSGWLTILTVRPRPALMCCSVRLSVMPHSAKSSARGDEISTTLSWNSGVNSSQYPMSYHTLLHGMPQLVGQSAS